VIVWATVKASAVRRLGRPTLVGYAALFVAVVVGVAVAIGWMRWEN